MSHAAAMRLVHLEDTLRALPGHIAVYYDANGLVSGDAGSAKLDIRRIPVQHRPGVFHAKNVFLLVEAEEADEEDRRPQTLIVASLSANLTRSGWWENVEVCHVEEIEDGEKTRLKHDLATFLEGLRRRTPPGDGASRLSGCADARMATHDHLVLIASDLNGVGDRTRELLLHIATRNDVLAVLVYDPFLLDLPPSGELVVSDGERQVELGFARGRTRKGIAEFTGARGRAILGWQREIGVPVIPLSAAEETAPQIRRLLGRVAWRQRRQ